VRALVALWASHADGGALRCPRVGWFAPMLRVGDRVEPGRVVGRLRVLARTHDVIAPDGAGGVVIEAVQGPRIGAEYGTELFRLGRAVADGGGTPTEQGAADAVAGYAVRAPIDGIFYLRPAPGAEPFVVLGAEVTTGQTLGLVEVMKTFNPVTLAGTGAPERGRVVAIEATELGEVRAGAVLFRIG
jgi:biotin carboxyl carrier protein